MKLSHQLLTQSIVYHPTETHSKEAKEKLVDHSWWNYHDYTNARDVMMYSLCAPHWLIKSSPKIGRGDQTGKIAGKCTKCLPSDNQQVGEQ